MADGGYTLVMTKGMSLVTSVDAARILDAVRAHDTTIDVRMDPFGALGSDRETTLVVAHVVLLTKNQPRTMELPANVARIGRQR